MRNDLMKHCQSVPEAITRGMFFGVVLGNLVHVAREHDLLLITIFSALVYMLFRMSYGYIIVGTINCIATKFAHRK
jgi:hypothetical protein